MIWLLVPVVLVLLVLAAAVAEFLVLLALEFDWVAWLKSFTYKRFLE